ncbi:formate dehydrogenase accessory sulfurtransferase FdhD [Methanomicrobium antiquum]|uniref:Formate dehydrogenase accessory sulfurtransferase FdhD n=1 Tax=Methanomicrobium antiquum TaxID=487686 RepID=A0AAF0FTH8_9EURY|nr:formate dehydrogenase accessory sulfurtransferase FdhD [Methanomicrobium antiquum]WFN37891.1 formate dehydrogenase accessory sulfurtransferase FdhD [Methanomicrobium antiquum]
MNKKYSCKEISGEKSFPCEVNLPEESSVFVYVNGRQAATAVVSPELLSEYAAGYLLTEGIIKNAEEIESVFEEGNRVSIITLNPRKMLFTKRTVLSGCGGGTIIVDYSSIPSAPKGTSFSSKRIMEASEIIKLYEKTDLTGEIYFAGLFTKDKTLAVAGDIGRENALDKAIGKAFLEKCLFPECFASFSGRISAETVRKCLFAQIPVIATTGSVTSLACDVARERNMTLISLEENRMCIFSGDENICE